MIYKYFVKNTKNNIYKLNSIIKFMNITVVIPVYNEEKVLVLTIKKVIKYLSSNFNKFEIIIVDDKSTDNTLKIIPKNKNITIITNKTNRGKGFSVKRGILAAKYPLVLFSDSDLSTPIEELDKLIPHINKFDFVIASRNMNESKIIIKQPIYRRIIGQIFAILVNTIVISDFKDTQCGFKLFKTNKIKRIVKLQTVERFSFDVELLYIAKKFGYKIKDVPVIWINGKESKIKLIKDCTNMLIDLFKIRYNNLIGKYVDSI